MADPQSTSNETEEQAAHTTKHPWISKLLGALLAVVLLGAAGAVSSYWLTHKPAAQQRPPQKSAVLVEAVPVSPEEHQVVIDAFGTVVPSRSTPLSARVGGEIEWLSPSFVPGGRFEKGERVAVIDPSDYELALAQAEAEVRRLDGVVAQCRSDINRLENQVLQSESNLKLEIGQQSVAQREYELFGDDVSEEDLELLLRKPQLQTAEAALKAAEAGLQTAEAACDAAIASREAAQTAVEKAKLDLERTVIRAPFNAQIRSRAVDLGAQISAGMQLAEIVDTDWFWVEAAVPVSALRWLDVPGLSAKQGSTAWVFYEAAWGPEDHREAEVLRLASELEPGGRLARLIVSVPDPLGLGPEKTGQPALILGAYVRVELHGKTVPDVAAIPRGALRDGNRVWLMLPDGSLEIRNVEPVWGDEDRVYIGDDLREGEMLVTSDLAAPVAGMALRIRTEGGAQ